MTSTVHMITQYLIIQLKSYIVYMIKNAVPFDHSDFPSVFFYDNSRSGYLVLRHKLDPKCSCEISRNATEGETGSRRSIKWQDRPRRVSFRRLNV